MVNKGPETEKGKRRKFWTGDGRRRTPDEEMVHGFRETNKAIRRTMREGNEATSVTFGGFKKKKSKGK
jgi:hypothetical protein